MMFWKLAVSVFRPDEPLKLSYSQSLGTTDTLTCQVMYLRTATIQKFRTHIFKFLTPLTPPMKKTVTLHGFKLVSKPRNIHVLFSQCES